MVHNPRAVTTQTLLEELMKLGIHALAVILGLGLGLAAPSFAQEEPKKEEPKKEEPAKEEAGKQAPAEEEGTKPEPAKEAPAKPAAAPPAAKELSSCAKSFAPLGDTYKSAYDDMQKWIGEIDAQTAPVNDKIQKLQAQIQQNDTAITQAKASKENAKAKDLQKQNKKLSEELNAAKKELSETCGKFSKEASSRVKQYTDATNKALDALKSQAK
jgi:hypothetical protein